MVYSSAYTSYNGSHLDCMVMHGDGGGAGVGGSGDGYTGGCCPCSTGTYGGAAFCNLLCVVIVLVAVVVVVAGGGGGGGQCWWWRW